ncbi:unnamed protein product [Chondrus crispus]|uniref:Uncharacterized protein n=1 Tax=Chondrus crispus TaxID=2769 RepID=R7QNB7_CHOCR|nr:unnamed protein product [Chondrus crispus]CDF38885.1 unnamed protein product [Chondrus crispus]|eukprot:XP_005718790.1 unnamed protein product [Chondrus crispus]
MLKESLVFGQYKNCTIAPAQILSNQQPCFSHFPNPWQFPNKNNLSYSPHVFVRSYSLRSQPCLLLLTRLADLHSQESIFTWTCRKRWPSFQRHNTLNIIVTVHHSAALFLFFIPFSLIVVRQRLHRFLFPSLSLIFPICFTVIPLPPYPLLSSLS